jgi:hypothetical protein
VSIIELKISGLAVFRTPPKRHYREPDALALPDSQKIVGKSALANN